MRPTLLAALAVALLALGGCDSGSKSSGGARATTDQATGTQLADELVGWQLAYAALERAGSSVDHLYVANADGSDAQQVDHLRGGKHQPFWSPDGSRIAFRWLPKDENHTPLVIINADGSHLVNLTKRTGLRGWAPSWSPDGRWIVTAATPKAGERNGLYIMRPDGSELRRITPSDREAQYSAWSPTDDVIAFTFVVEGDFDIYTIHSDGSDLRRLTNDGAAGQNNWPMWSPDGKRIAWGKGEGIWVMNADGSEKHEVTTVGGVPAAWAPGPFIAFGCRSAKSEASLCAVDAEGERLTHLLGGRQGSMPGWRPRR